MTDAPALGHPSNLEGEYFLICRLTVDGRHKRLVSEHKIFMYIQNLSNKQMKKTYLMPTIELEELVVESGIAQSLPGVEIDGWDEDGGVTIDF